MAKKIIGNASGVKRQHYVPQFLIRNFYGGTDKKKKICVFDKHTESVFDSKPMSLAQENGFYDIENDDGTAVSLEDFLSQIESDAAPIIKEIVLLGKLGDPDDEVKSKLAQFVAIQLLRTRALRNTLRDAILKLEEAIIKRHPELTGKEISGLAGSSNDVKKTSVKLLIDSYKEHTVSLLKKGWLLLEAPMGTNFLIGDSPVSMHNSLPQGHLGNIGLECQGIEIYLPLSPRYQLMILCETLAFAMTEGEHFYSKTVLINEENVKLCNSLQVKYSERFVFSKRNDFSLVKEMIQRDPSFKNSARMTIN